MACKDGCSRAASLITGFAELGQEVTSGQLAPEPNGRGEEKLCSNGYKFLFHSCRVPGAEKDAVNCYNPEMFNGEILVSRKNHFFSLNITGLNTAAIEAELQKIVAMADTAAPNIGALTTASRDLWYSARTKLLTNADNAAAMEKLERTMFMVCLDDSSPITPTDTGRHSLNGPSNRFFDKTMALVVYENGKAVFLGEHAKSDGSPTARLCDDLLTRLANGEVDHSVPAVSGSASASAIEPLPMTVVRIPKILTDPYSSTSATHARSRALAAVALTVACRTRRWRRTSPRPKPTSRRNGLTTTGAPCASSATARKR